MMGFSRLGFFLMFMYLAVPTFVLYFAVKLAVKSAVRELKDEQII